MWNTSVSDHCCQSCGKVVFKADSVMDTVNLEDECQTTETSVCRILPGEYIESNVSIYFCVIIWINLPKILIKLLSKKSLTTKNAALMKKVC